jgi:hypothetical protein
MSCVRQSHIEDMDLALGTWDPTEWRCYEKEAGRIECKVANVCVPQESGFP